MLYQKPFSIWKLNDKLKTLFDQIEDDLKDENNIKNEEDTKYEDDFNNEDDQLEDCPCPSLHNRSCACFNTSSHFQKYEDDLKFEKKNL